MLLSASKIKRVVITFLETIFLSMLLNNPRHTDHVAHRRINRDRRTQNKRTGLLLF